MQSKMVGGADKATFKRGGLPPKRGNIPPPQPNAKGTQMGAFFAFGFESAIRAIPLRVMSHDERSSLGERRQALPVADEACLREWQRSKKSRKA